MLNYHSHASNCVILIHIFKDTESNDQDGEEQKPTFLKTIDNILDSKPVVITKNLSKIAKERLSAFSKDFKSTLRDESAKQVNGKNQERNII